MSKYPGGPTACSDVVETGTGGLIALEIITDCKLLYVVVFFRHRGDQGTRELRMTLN